MLFNDAGESVFQLADGTYVGFLRLHDRIEKVYFPTDEYIGEDAIVTIIADGMLRLLGRPQVGVN